MSVNEKVRLFRELNQCLWLDMQKLKEVKRI